MVSKRSPSYQQPLDTVIDAAGLCRMVEKDSCPVCIIDCRLDGSPIRKATRVRLPHMILRRIQQGSMSMKSVCPLLSEPRVQVVLIPEVPDGGGQMTEVIASSLRGDSFSLQIFIGEVEEALAKYPSMRFSEPPSPLPPSIFSSSLTTPSTVASTERPGEDVSWLNLRSLRIDSSAGEGREKQKQCFPVQILPYLFLGNAEVASNREFLERIGITHIINVTSNLPNAFEGDCLLKYKRISVDDNCSHNLAQFFPDAITFIRSAAESGGRCLVHCLAGISRSVTICIAYLMTIHRCNLEDAYDEVLRCNASIAPNFHFMGQLSEYEAHLAITPKSSRSSNAGLVPPHSPCSVEAASTSEHASQPYPSPSCLTPPPTSCSVSPHSYSSHSAKSFMD